MKEGAVVVIRLYWEAAAVEVGDCRCFRTTQHDPLIRPRWREGLPAVTHELKLGTAVAALHRTNERISVPQILYTGRCPLFGRNE